MRKELMPPNTKKCERCGNENPKQAHSCHLPLKPTEKCNCLHSHLACQYNNPPCHTPPPEKEKCLHIKALNESGIKIPEGYICRACTPSTPAVEDWEYPFGSYYGRFVELYRKAYPNEKGNVPDEAAYDLFLEIKSLIRSLRESDRKRILKWAEKEKRHDILYFSDLVAFITNLK